MTGMRGAPEAGAPRLALLSLAAILVVTVAWWALALWPSGSVPPAWLLRTRQVCFNAGPSGLPGPSGWLLLIGQPVGMVAMLLAIAGDSLRDGLRRARRTVSGRAGLGLGVGVAVAGLVLVGLRVGKAAAVEAEWLGESEQMVPESYPRLERAPPALGLVDQHGDTLQWGRFAGSPVLLTFAFGHCATVCPLVVHNAVRVQETFLTEGVDIPVLVVTLDPWRDTPGRLPHLAEQLMVGDSGFVLSGSVDEVNRVLDGLQVPRERDLQTGDITHPSLVYILGPEGEIVYGASGHAPLMEALLRRL